MNSIDTARKLINEIHNNIIEGKTVFAEGVMQIKEFYEEALIEQREEIISGIEKDTYKKMAIWDSNRVISWEHLRKILKMYKEQNK